MSLKKCTTRQTTLRNILDIVYYTPFRGFEVPESKLETVELLLNNVFQDGWISLPNLEELGGKCTSMGMITPPASLHTYHMYKTIAQYQRSWGSSMFAIISSMPNNGLRSEM